MKRRKYWSFRKRSGILRNAHLCLRSIRRGPRPSEEIPPSKNRIIIHLLRRKSKYMRMIWIPLSSCRSSRECSRSTKKTENLKSYNTVHLSHSSTRNRERWWPIITRSSKDNPLLCCKVILPLVDRMPKLSILVLTCIDTTNYTSITKKSSEKLKSFKKLRHKTTCFHTLLSRILKRL